MRRSVLIALALCGCLVTACGDGGEDATPAPPGSTENPVAATLPEGADVTPATGERSNEATATSGTTEAEQPGYKALVDRQSSKPRSRFTPCNLVDPARARAIVGEPLRPPVEAPQGPTCVYRTQKGDAFVTIAVQRARFAQLKRQIRRPQAIDVSSRTAVCGVLGQPMLYVALGGGRVLSIAAPCDTATALAREAVQQLEA